MPHTPQVFIIAAITLDGFIAQDKLQSAIEWTSHEDNQFFHQKTKEAGVVIMGSNTYKTINPKYLPLSDRLNVVYSHQSPEKLVKNLGIDQKKISSRNLRTTQLDPAQLVKQLADEGYQQIAICGGSSIYTQFLQVNLVHKLYLTVEPVIFGDGVKLFSQAYFKKQKLISTKKLNDQGSLLLEYQVDEEDES